MINEVTKSFLGSFFVGDVISTSFYVFFGFLCLMFLVLVRSRTTRVVVVLIL